MVSRKSRCPLMRAESNEIASDRLDVEETGAEMRSETLAYRM